MGAALHRPCAFVETVEHGAEAGGDLHEWASAAKSLKSRGYAVQRFTANEMVAADLGISSNTPVVIGSRSSMRQALKSIGAIHADGHLPERPDYPMCLSEFLGRCVRPALLQQALDESATGPVFTKPRGAAHTKLFTGCVLDGTNGWRLDRVSRDTPVWLSSVLEGMLAEWRCYCLHGRVEASVCYHGNEVSAPLDRARVEAAAATLHASVEEGSAAFALDVGVLSDGRTVLIEVNDGFSLGLYPGCPAELYASMMVARWRELAHEGNGLRDPKSTRHEKCARK